MKGELRIGAGAIRERDIPQPTTTSLAQRAVIRDERAEAATAQRERVEHVAR